MTEAQESAVHLKLPPHPQINLAQPSKPSPTQTHNTLQQVSRFHNGTWATNMALSESYEPLMVAMGVNFLIRKFVTAFPITTEIHTNAEGMTYVSFVAFGVQREFKWHFTSEPYEIHEEEIGPATARTSVEFVNGYPAIVQNKVGNKKKSWEARWVIPSLAKKQRAIEGEWEKNVCDVADELDGAKKEEMKMMVFYIVWSDKEDPSTAVSAVRVLDLVQ